MTTIACNRSEMSCDSRASWDEGEFYRCDDKIVRMGNALVGCAGSDPAINKFLAWLSNPSQERPEFDEDKGFHALVLDSKGITAYFNSTYGGRVMEPYFSIGSGSMAAKAAMLCGKSPAEAVAVAIKCDKNSGGPVRNYTLRD